MTENKKMETPLSCNRQLFCISVKQLDELFACWLCNAFCRWILELRNFRELVRIESICYFS